MNSLDRVGEWMRLMTKHEHTPGTLMDILYRGDRDDVIWEAEHCAEAWEKLQENMDAMQHDRRLYEAELITLRQRLEAAEKENAALRANASKSVLRRLEAQCALAAGKEK